ncbi:MAG: sugar phosphate isomerase/epimerase, partial [Clostridia bacterium]|nr:sugar phosphate isomerase/epimerase [Clostridia bacterium]
ACQIATHVGFIPEDPNTELYAEVVQAVRTVAERCAQNEQYFLFETGQETPVTLLRTMLDVGLDNLGVNLDPSNLIMYGKANPVDALGVIGKYVRDVHAKDGCYPTDGRTLGREMPLGEGLVNFPALIKGLQALGYDGAITIEREISGEQQIADIMKAKALLENCINQ